MGATVICNAQFVTEPLEVKEELRSRSCRAAREKRGRGFEMRGFGGICAGEVVVGG